MNALGINKGTSGNISLRDGEGFLITPTSMPYDLMQPEDIIEMRFDHSVVGNGRPSTEWRFHLDILRARPEVNAIVHAHPIYCTTLAIMERSIPPIHYMVCAAGGDTIRCAPYATFGTQELSDNAVEALKDRKACLLAHHGMIAVGDDLRGAVWLAVEVENLAHQYVNCLQLGEPPLRREPEAERDRHDHAETGEHAQRRRRLFRARSKEIDYRLPVNARCRCCARHVSTHG